MPGKDPASTALGQSNVYLQRAYALSSVDAAKALYDEWANEYDQDLSAHDYMSPRAAVDTLIQHLGPNGSENLTILDAGCGTGLVGVCLQNTPSSAERNWTIDGVDLTPGMLSVASQKSIYRSLSPADLNLPLSSIRDESYDAVTCVGTLTKGHVGPGCFGEFVRVVKRVGGLVVATVHGEIWESGGFEAEVERLAREGEGRGVEILGTGAFGIIAGETTGGRMVVLRRM